MGFIVAFICIASIFIEPGYPVGNAVMIFIAVVAVVAELYSWVPPEYRRRGSGTRHRSGQNYTRNYGQNYTTNCSPDYSSGDSQGFRKDPPLPPDLYDPRYDMDHDGQQTTFEKSVQYEDWVDAVNDNDGEFY